MRISGAIECRSIAGSHSCFPHCATTRGWSARSRSPNRSATGCRTEPVRSDFEQHPAASRNAAAVRASWAQGVQGVGARRLCLRARGGVPGPLRHARKSMGGLLVMLRKAPGRPSVTPAASGCVAAARPARACAANTYPRLDSDGAPWSPVRATRRSATSPSREDSPAAGPAPGRLGVDGPSAGGTRDVGILASTAPAGG